MSNRKKWIIILIIAVVLIMGFVIWRASKSDDLDQQAKDKQTTESAINHKSQKGQPEKQEKTSNDTNNESQKEGALKKNQGADEKLSAPKKNKKDAPEKPDKKDLNKKTKKFTEILVKPKTSDNVQGLRSEFSDIATKSLTDRMFSDHMTADDDNNKMKAINIKTKPIKVNKKEQQVQVTYDVEGQSPESHKIETLKEDISINVWFKYEDGQFKVDQYKQ